MVSVFLWNSLQKLFPTGPLGECRPEPRSRSTQQCSTSDDLFESCQRHPTRQRFTLIELLVARQPKPWRRPTRERFTLIELLVVVGIISILAAMLLPALESARQMARRMTCLSDRRQNYLSLQYYTSDHNSLPPGTGEAKVADHTPLGRLIRNGYVEVPGLMFCPDFGRPRKSENPDSSNGPGTVSHFYWDQPVERLESFNQDLPWESNTASNINPHIWDEDLSGVPEGQSMTGVWAGVTVYSIARIEDTNNDGNVAFNDDAIYWGEITLTGIATYWAKSVRSDSSGLDYWESVSPMLLSCANYGKRFYNVTDSWYHKGLGNLGWSHNISGIPNDADGVNGAFYDGSARWVSSEEWRSHGFSDGNYANRNTPDLQEGARKVLTLTSP